MSVQFVPVRSGPNHTRAYNLKAEYNGKEYCLKNMEDELVLVAVKRNLRPDEPLPDWLSDDFDDDPERVVIDDPDWDGDVPSEVLAAIEAHEKLGDKPLRIAPGEYGP